jgi:hypothetical protein
MEVTLRQHGGFAGTSSVVTKKVGAESAQLRPLLDQIKDLAEKHNPVGADFIRYELSVKDSGTQTVISFADDGSDTARQLMELANKISGGSN